jgi:hypothetical protein
MQCDQKHDARCKDARRHPELYVRKDGAEGFGWGELTHATILMIEKTVSKLHQISVACQQSPLARESYLLILYR